MPNGTPSAAQLAVIVQKVTAALQSVFAPLAAIPFQYRNVPQNAQIDGIGRLFIVTVAQNTPYTITHQLGRVPVHAMVIDNGAAAQTLLQVTARTNTTITVVPLSAALTNAIVRVA